MATIRRTRTAKSNKKTATTASPEVARVTTQAVEIRDVIRRRAYELFEQRGCGHGCDFDDWLRAEAEVLERFGARTA